MTQITVVTKQPGQAPVTQQVEHNDYHDLAKLIAIGDFTMLEHVGDSPVGLDLWANEEGKYASEMVTIQTSDGPRQQQRYAEANLAIFDGQDFVMGPVFVAATDDKGETIGLTPAQVEAATLWLKQHAVSILGAAKARAFAEQFR